MAARKRRGSATEEKKKPGRRKRRARPIPKWLSESRELDDIAKRRCLMILSTLSGEKPVSDVLEEAELSRGTYYQLEQKALEAMLAALVPGASIETTEAGSPRRRIAELEAKVAQLEKAKRRTERLLHLARQVVGPGPMKTGKGPKRKRRRSTTKATGTTGRKRLKRTKDVSAETPRVSAETLETTSMSSPTTPAVSSSIPISGGAVES